MRWSLVAVILVVLPFLAEGVARLLFDPPGYMQGMVYDPDLGFRQPPHSEVIGWWHDPEGPFDYRTNAEGFRGPELPAPGEALSSDKTRLLFIGDSFLDGNGVRREALIPFSCEAELQARGHHVQAFSFCHAGLGTAQELILFRRHAERVQPSVVVLALYTGNDVVDNTPELVGHTTVSPGSYVRPFLVSDGRGGLETFWLNPVRTALRRHSRLFQIVEVRLLSAGLIEDPASPERVPSQNDSIAAGGLPATRLELLLPPEPGGPWEAGWRRTEDLVRAFRREVEAMGARFVLVSIPMTIQVQEDAMSYTMDASLRSAHQPSIGERVDWNLPEERLAAFTQAEGIDYVPLLDALRARTAETRRSCYFWGGHLSARGHRIAGRVVADALEKVLAGGSLPAGATRSSEPFDLLAADSTESGVCFAEDLHSEVLLANWLNWEPVGNEVAAGWEMSQKRSSMGVTVRSGRLIVEGWALRPGTKLTVFVDGQSALGPLALERPGPFALEVPSAKLPGGDGAFIGVDLAVAGEETPRYPGVVVTGICFE